MFVGQDPGARAADTTYGADLLIIDAFTRNPATSTLPIVVPPQKSSSVLP